MATHRKKVVEVHARQWAGPGTMAVYHKVKGDMSAKKGDWLVGPDDAQHGEIEVVKDTDFQRDYEPIGEEPVEETHLGNAEGELPTTEPAQE